MNKLFIFILISIIISGCKTRLSYESIGLDYIMNYENFEEDLSIPCSGKFNITDSLYVYNKSYGKPDLFYVKDLLNISDSIIFKYDMSEFYSSNIKISLDRYNEYNIKYTNMLKYKYDKDSYTYFDNNTSSKKLKNKFYLLRISEPFKFHSNIVIEYYFKRGYYCSGTTFTIVFDTISKTVVRCVVNSDYQDRNG